MTKAKPIRITIYVSGGVVQDVLADRAGVEAMIVDYDNEQAGDSRDDRSFAPVTVDVEFINKTEKGIEDDTLTL